MVRFIYQDHCRLRDENDKMREELAKKPTNPYEISVNDEYASITNTIQAFRFLMPPQSKTCWVRITAPRENRHIASILAGFATIFCRVDAPHDPSEPDDAVLQGSLNDKILVHMKKTIPDRGSFITALGNSFSVRRTYDLPPDLPEETVWLQIGQGNPWRKSTTKLGTDD